MSQWQRVRLDVAYDGSEFHGWARQPGLRTVEGDLEAALSVIFQRPVSLTVAGRTDAGVHARSQAAHFDLTGQEVGALGSLQHRLQGLLHRSFSAAHPGAGRNDGSDLVVLGVSAVDSSFDARFSAVERQYCYRIADAQAQLDPLRRANVWWQPRTSLDLAGMEEAAQPLVGQRDYLSFCKPREGATTIRHVREVAISRTPDGTVEFRVRGDAFCHGMVRSLVGALVEVGRGKKSASWVGELLQRPSRDHGVPVAPARGLTLEGVIYPPADRWAERARQARAVRG